MTGTETGIEASVLKLLRNTEADVINILVALHYVHPLYKGGSVSSHSIPFQPLQCYFWFIEKKENVGNTIRVIIKNASINSFFHRRPSQKPHL